MRNSSGLLLIAFIVLLVVIAFFAILDRLIKNSGSKKPVEKKPEPKKTTEKVEPAPAPVETPKTIPAMKIYNSQLADDLNEIIKKNDNDKSARLKIENHIHKEGNISKYIKGKNYQGFNFGTDEINADEEDKPMSFTIDDYKRIMALSNIDDKK
ncbi:MAG: hypothetical protein IJ295_00685 [Clostridia bacterium]|nr:hypothetical protein [Clostridia bacterium]